MEQGSEARVSEADLGTRELGMFRYAPFLGLKDLSRLPGIRFGGTPLVRVAKNPRFPFRGELFIKNEGLNPTASMKDRSAAFVCMKALEMGRNIITTATSGNAGAAFSMASAVLGLDCRIFVPSEAPAAKIIQSKTYGAKLYLVNGEYDDAVSACKAAASKFGWYLVNRDENRLPIEGMRTVSFEICDQLTDIFGHGTNGTWKTPTHIITPLGEGCVLTAIYKGLVDLKKHNFIDKIPKIIGVQAVGSNSLAICWRQGGDPTKIPTVEIDTIADSLACRYPGEGVPALNAVHESNGCIYDATNEEILAAMSEMAQLSGVLPEPASATSWAGMKKAAKDGVIGDKDVVVLICTGNGLKDVASLKMASSKEQ